MPTYANSIAADGTILNAAEASARFAEEQGWTLIPKGSGAGIGWRIVDGVFVAPEPLPATAEKVDRERDRRMREGFTFAGTAYQLDETSERRIIAMGADARFAVAGRAEEGDLRWADPEQDFAWIASDNSEVPMDAQTMAALADAAKLWISRHARVARTLKNMEPIPADYAADEHWPEGEP